MNLTQGLMCAVILFGAVPDQQALASDCTVSKEFRIKNGQALAGVLQDPFGAPLPGIDLELLSHKTIFRRVETNSQGTYDFGQVPAGKYRIHLYHAAGNHFCAPRVVCSKDNCKIQARVEINLKNAVLVH